MMSEASLRARAALFSPSAAMTLKQTKRESRCEGRTLVQTVPQQKQQWRWGEKTRRHLDELVLTEEAGTSSRGEGR